MTALSAYAPRTAASPHMNIWSITGGSQRAVLSFIILFSAVKVLSSLLNEGRSVTYVLGCGVAPAARRDFRVLAAMAHFNRRLLREKDVIAADFSNGELLSLCAGQGNFEIKKLDEDYWFFLRR